MKAQNVKKCATPGTDQVSSLRWPKTSTSWAFARAPMPSSMDLGRLPGSDQSVEVVAPPTGDGQGGHRHEQTDGESHKTSWAPGRPTRPRRTDT